MNLEQVKREIEDLGKSPVAERMYPVTSEWVPITDVLAIIERFERHWKQYKRNAKNESEVSLITEIVGDK